MPDYTITLTAQEKIVIEAFGINIQRWIEKALRHKALRCGDRAITMLTSYNPSKLTLQEKIDILTILYNEGKLDFGSLRND